MRYQQKVASTTVYCLSLISSPIDHLRYKKLKINTIRNICISFYINCLDGHDIKRSLNQSTGDKSLPAVRS